MQRPCAHESTHSATADHLLLFQQLLLLLLLDANKKIGKCLADRHVRRYALCCCVRHCFEFHKTSTNISNGLFGWWCYIGRGSTKFIVGFERCLLIAQLFNITTDRYTFGLWGAQFSAKKQDELDLVFVLEHARILNIILRSTQPANYIDSID